MSNTFTERYAHFFEQVCPLLGTGWRIDYRQNDIYRMILMNPDYRNYTISVRYEKERFCLMGSVSKCRRNDTYSACTVSTMRNAASVAGDIRRKILTEARSIISIYEADRAGAEMQREDRKNLIHLLGRIMDVYEYDRGTNVLCGITSAHGIRGDVTDRYGGYQLNLTDLSKDQLIKVVGLISNLER